VSLKNDIKDVKAQLQVIWHQWKNNTPSNINISELSETNDFDISRHIVESCVFSKNLGSAAGSFTFRLDNSRDWKDIMKPGQWCLIFMSNDGDLVLPNKAQSGKGAEKLSRMDRNVIQKKRLRGMCYIERIAANVVMTEGGVLDVVYEVSGRDFGVVYEQTDIWYNYFKFEQTLVTGLAEQIKFTSQNSIKELVDTTHSLFFSPQVLIKSKEKNAVELTEVGTQWVLPRTMLSVLDIALNGSKPFYGNIKGITENFKDTLCKIPIINPLDYINGNAWEKLKQFSIEELHELFPELDENGQPRLNFRPIPWAINPVGYPRIFGRLKNNPLLYLDLAEKDNILIKAIDVEEFTTGEDNHNRYNHFFVTSQTSFNLAESNISILKNLPSVVGRTYPNLQKDSVQRHGFRPMHIDINTFGFAADKTSKNKNGKVDAKLLIEYNELVLDYWNNAVFFESGDAKILGRNDIRLGKAITFDSNVPYNANKIFYVEEYVDEFTIEPGGEGYWSQTLQLSRGIEKEDLRNIKNASNARNLNLSSRNEDFTEIGDYVKDE